MDLLSGKVLDTAFGVSVIAVALYPYLIVMFEDLAAAVSMAFSNSPRVMRRAM